MKPLLILAAIALSACQMSLPGLLSMTPTSAETCAMSGETRAEVVAALHTTEAAFAAACEIVN